jgi:hypothetical protein
VGYGLPAFLSHQGPVPEFEVRDLELLAGNHILLTYGKLLFAFAGHVDRNGLPAIVDGDLDYHLLDGPGPEGQDILCLCPLHPFVAGQFNGGNLNADGVVPAFRDKVFFYAAFFIFREFNGTDDRCPFAGDDCLDEQGLRLAFFWNPLVVTAGSAPDQLIAGFGYYFVFGLIPALRAMGGNKH